MTGRIGLTFPVMIEASPGYRLVKRMNEPLVATNYAPSRMSMCAMQ